MDKKEKYIAKTKGGTDTMSTKDSKLIKLYKQLEGASSDKEKLMTYKALSDMLGDVKGVGSFADIKMLKKALPTKKDGGMVKKRAKSTAKKSRGMGVAKRGGKFKGTF